MTLMFHLVEFLLLNLPFMCVSDISEQHGDNFWLNSLDFVQHTEIKTLKCVESVCESLMPSYNVQAFVSGTYFFLFLFFRDGAIVTAVWEMAILKVASKCRLRKGEDNISAEAIWNGMEETEIRTAGPGGPAGPVSPSLPGRPWGEGGRRGEKQEQNRK